MNVRVIVWNTLPLFLVALEMRLSFKDVLWICICKIKHILCVFSIMCNYEIHIVYEYSSEIMKPRTLSNKYNYKTHKQSQPSEIINPINILNQHMYIPINYKTTNILSTTFTVGWTLLTDRHSIQLWLIHFQRPTLQKVREMNQKLHRKIGTVSTPIDHYIIISHSLYLQYHPLTANTHLYNMDNTVKFHSLYNSQ